MAKFKVGDKVRVREDLVVGEMYGANSFSIGMEKYKGSIQEIKLEDGGQYKFENENYWWTDKMLEEVKENKMEKTFREVIADIKEGEVWESLSRTIAFKEGKVLIERKNGLSCPYVLIDEKEKYKIQREEYTFVEAFKAYEEGKEIESVCSGYRYKKENGEDVAILSADWQEFDYFELYEIRGKWYIND